jgi:chromosome partitioning protein
MSVYAMWNNKGGVGKSYLTFQIASEYARTHPNEKILVIDLCPQANASSMLLGGIIEGERHLDNITSGGRLRRDSVSVPLSGSSAGWVHSVPLPGPRAGRALA